MDIEQQVGRLEKKIRRLQLIMSLLTVVLCAVVALGASSRNHATFDSVTTKVLVIENRAGENVAMLDGHGP